MIYLHPTKEKNVRVEESAGIVSDGLEDSGNEVERAKRRQGVPSTALHLPRQKVDARGYMLDKELELVDHCFDDEQSKDIPYKFLTNQPDQEFGRNMNVFSCSLAPIFTIYKFQHG